MTCFPTNISLPDNNPLAKKLGQALPLRTTTGSASSYFTHDGSQRRIKQVANGETTLYLAPGYERVLKPANTIEQV
ncbi:MAG: hypothetical protein JKY01_07905 [Pseudomonadales bacterium]|nr:hypothetical protein [Pseudomonadales bacterium]